MIPKLTIQSKKFGRYEFQCIEFDQSKLEENVCVIGIREIGQDSVKIRKSLKKTIIGIKKNNDILDCILDLPKVEYIGATRFEFSGVIKKFKPVVIGPTDKPVHSIIEIQAIRTPKVSSF